KVSVDCFASLAMTLRGFSGALLQPPHHFVELFEVAIADLEATARIAMIDGYAKAERVADAFFQLQRIGVFGLAGARLLRLALRHAFVMRQRFSLTDVEPVRDDAPCASER